MDDQKRLQEHVNSIAFDLQNGVAITECPCCGQELDTGECAFCGEVSDDIETGWAYLQGVLDIEYVVSGKREYLGARILVAFGGPNIWVDTRKKRVEGYWWGSYAEATYSEDVMGVDEALNELWECTA